MPGEPLAVHPLTFVRQSHGWGKAEFARLMRSHGTSLGISLATNRTTVRAASLVDAVRKSLT